MSTEDMRLVESVLQKLVAAPLPHSAVFAGTIKDIRRSSKDKLTIDQLEKELLRAFTRINKEPRKRRGRDTELSAITGALDELVDVALRLFYLPLPQGLGIQGDLI